MRLGIAARFVLADPEIEGVAGHEGFDAAKAGRAAIVERQIAIDRIGHEIGAPHGKPAHRIGLDVVIVFVIIVGAGEAVAELHRAIEDRIHRLQRVHHDGRGGAGQEQRRRGPRIDDAVHGVHRNREQRTLLPFEDVFLGIAVLPHFGGAAALDDEVDFLVEMLFGVERARARHLDDVIAPFGFGAVQLDIAAAPAPALPRLKGQVLHLGNADVAETGMPSDSMNSS